DRDQRGDAPGAAGAPGARMQRRQTAGNLGDAARVDQLAVARQVRRHDPLVPAGLEEVHEAGEDEERAKKSPHAGESTRMDERAARRRPFLNEISGDRPYATPEGVAPVICSFARLTTFVPPIVSSITSRIQVPLILTPVYSASSSLPAVPAKGRFSVAS